jgi:hypothetical protein
VPIVGTPSGVVQRVLARLRAAELRGDHAAAWDKWTGDEADAWESVVADGLHDVPG